MERKKETKEEKKRAGLDPADFWAAREVLDERLSGWGLNFFFFFFFLFPEKFRCIEIAQEMGENRETKTKLKAPRLSSLWLFRKKF